MNRILSAFFLTFFLIIQCSNLLYGAVLPVIIDVQEPNSEALFAFIKKGDIYEIKKILDKKPELVNQVYNHETPLHQAVICDNNDIIILLLQRGANVSKKNDGGTTALSLATIYSRTEAVKILRNYTLASYLPYLPISLSIIVLIAFLISSKRIKITWIEKTINGFSQLFTPKTKNTNTGIIVSSSNKTRIKAKLTTVLQFLWVGIGSNQARNILLFIIIMILLIPYMRNKNIAATSVERVYVMNTVDVTGTVEAEITNSEVPVNVENSELNVNIQNQSLNVEVDNPFPIQVSPQE